MMNHKAVYRPEIKDIELSDKHCQIVTLNQLQQMVRLATIEHSLHPNKEFSYHLFDMLYTFNRKEAINFLMVGVADDFFEANREIVLSLVGKYFLGDYTKRVICNEFKYN